MDIGLTMKIAYGYLFPVICSAGLFGNAIMLATLLFGSLRESPYIYLSTLAIADLIALIGVAGICMVRCADCGQPALWAEYAGKIFEVYGYLPFTNIAATLISFTTLLMTFERFVYVRYPLSATAICTRQKTKRIVCLLAFLSVILNSPRFLLYEVHFKVNTSAIINNSTPSFLALNCVPSQSDYASKVLGQGPFYCNVSIIMENWNQLELNSPREQCQLNKGHLEGEENVDLIYKESLFSYANGNINEEPNLIVEILDDYDIYLVNFTLNETDHQNKVSSKSTFTYNLTDSSLIQKLLLNFPCERSSRWGVDFDMGPYQTLNITNAKVIKTPFSRLLSDHYFLFLSCSYIVPYIAVAILNCYIVLLVRRSSVRRRNILMESSVMGRDLKSVRQRDQFHLTITLICLTGIQILANVVYFLTIPIIARRIYGRGFYSKPTYQIHVVISNLCLLMQYSSNFLFFAFLNGKFQREFRKLLVTRISSKMKNRRDRLTESIKKLNLDIPPIITNKIKTVSQRLSTSTLESLCLEE